MILGVAAIAAAAVVVAGRTPSPARVISLAAAAGVTFGVLDALTKSWVDLLSARGAPAMLRWEPYALLAAGLLGTYLTQTAFRAGALAVSLPVIDTLEPVSAVLIGATVFGERLAASPAQLSAQLAAGAVATGGIAALSHSSVAAAEITPGSSARAPGPGPNGLPDRD